MLYVDTGHMFHKGSNVAKKIDALVQKGLSDSQYRGFGVAYKENNVHNIYVKPRETRLMRCHCLEIQNRGVAGWVRTCKTRESRSLEHEIQKFQEEHMIPCENGICSVQKLLSASFLRRVERMRTPHERKEICLKIEWIMASLVVTQEMCCRPCVSSAGIV